MHVTYLIPSDNAERLGKRLNKLVKAAKKCGSLLLVTWMPEVFWPHPDAKRRAAGEVIELHPVTVEGVSPKLAGWSFIATLEHVEGAVLLRAVPGETVPEAYRSAKPGDCDHCKKFRRRKESFVVRHDDGTYKVVGRNCLADFLGHADPAMIADYATMLSSLSDDLACDGEGGWGGGSKSAGTELWSFLAATAACIDKSGWVSRAEARDKGLSMATADEASHLFSLCLSPDCKAHHAVVEDRHVAEAKTAIEWAKTASGNSDYIHNVRVVANAAIMRWSMAGIAASIIAAYRRELKKEIEAKALADKTANSTYVGAVGKRMTLDLTLTFVTSFEGNWGATHLYKFLDSDGNVVTWFSSRDARLTMGSAYRVKGTIKKHEEYKGTRNTVLTCCVVEGA